MGDEYGDENETSLQIFGLWDWRWSSGDCQVHGKWRMIVFMFICACNCCADVRLPDSTEDACKCVFLLCVGVYRECFARAVQQQFVPQLRRFPSRTGLEMSARLTPSVTRAILIKVVCVNVLINNHCVCICAQRQKSPT